MTVPPFLTAMMSCLLGGMFSEQGTLTPSTGGAAFPITIVFGDNADAFVTIDTGMGENRTTPATIQLSVCAADMGRAPARADVITINAGQTHAGAWIVESAVTDVGDGVSLTLTQPTHHGIAGQGIVKA